MLCLAHRILLSSLTPNVVSTNKSFKLLLATVKLTSRTMATKAKNNQVKKPKLVWIDCEMSGLNVSSDKLLEIAMILTDAKLNEIETVGPLVIKTDKAVLDSMNEWCMENHGKSGLINQCLESKLSAEDVDQQLADTLEKHGVTNGCTFIKFYIIENSM